MRCQPYIEWMDRDAGELVTSLTGCPPTCDHGPKMLWWKNERPEDYRRTAKFVMPGTYVAGRMAGLKASQAFIDYTYIHFSGFSDARQTAWSEELCGKFSLDMEKLPEIVEPWKVIGEVSAASAKEFGLASRHPHRSRGWRYRRECAGGGDRGARHGFRCGRHRRGSGKLHGCLRRGYQTPRPADHALGYPWVYGIRLHILVAVVWLCAGSAISFSILPGEQRSRWKEISTLK